MCVCVRVFVCSGAVSCLHSLFFTYVKLEVGRRLLSQAGLIASSQTRSVLELHITRLT